MSTREREPLTAKVEPELKHQFRVEAAKKDKTMSAYLRDIVSEEVGFDEHED